MLLRCFLKWIGLFLFKVFDLIIISLLLSWVSIRNFCLVLDSSVLIILIRQRVENIKLRKILVLRS